ncbi:hypothetical protein LTR97_007874 [Elasticomyces elasticus]|uniref:RBR-type E3 ubiquitin transferase n=1 Tax=Elasticomyces elasticus TaxID=574655 RepID=A0AAN7W7N3_9PEZI|nr:hypothetical protein LTR97_007874 [Elasticomyces elasticus]
MSSTMSDLGSAMRRDLSRRTRNLANNIPEEPPQNITLEMARRRLAAAEASVVSATKVLEAIQNSRQNSQLMGATRKRKYDAEDVEVEILAKRPAIFVPPTRDSVLSSSGHAEPRVRKSSRKPYMDSATISTKPVRSGEVPSAFLRRLAKSKECTVCTESYTSEQFPSGVHSAPPTWRFGSPICPARLNSNSCNGCWQQHIRTAIDNSTDQVVHCQECDVALNDVGIKTLATAEDYQRYHDKLSVSFIKQDPDYRECASADCSYGYILAKGDGTIFHCQLCDSGYCVDCEAPWHVGKTCEQHQDSITSKKRKEKGNAASEKKIKDTTKPCPSCKTAIEKNRGCQHMTCLNCSHQFCWVCFSPYTGPKGIMIIGNHAHVESCRYYAPPPPRSGAAQQRAGTFGLAGYVVALPAVPPPPAPEVHDDLFGEPADEGFDDDLGGLFKTRRQHESIFVDEEDDMDDLFGPRRPRSRESIFAELEEEGETIRRFGDSPAPEHGDAEAAILPWHRRELEQENAGPRMTLG